jgi:hypothetical protein
MLVYERTQPYRKAEIAAAPGSIPVSPQPAPAITPAGASAGALSGLKKLVDEEERQSSHVMEQLERLARKDPREIVDVLPKRITEAVDADNEQFLRDRMIFQPAYFRFIADLLRVAQPAPVMELEPAAGQANPGLGPFAARAAEAVTAAAV